MDQYILVNIYIYSLSCIHMLDISSVFSSLPGIQDVWWLTNKGFHKFELCGGSHEHDLHTSGMPSPKLFLRHLNLISAEFAKRNRLEHSSSMENNHLESLSARGMLFIPKAGFGRLGTLSLQSRSCMQDTIHF